MADSIEQIANRMVLMNPLLNPTGFVQHTINPHMAPNALDNGLIKYAIDKRENGISENIGNYKITKLDENKYSVALTNGNLGAKVCTKAEVEALKKQEEEKLIQQQNALANYGKAQVNLQ